MPRLGTAAARVLALAALALVLQAHAASSVATAGGRGRDVSACVKSCNTIKGACQEACSVDCALLYLPGEERTACVTSCRSECVDGMQDCKAKCNVNKEPPSGVEP